jgi:hypothetical protein
MAPRLLFALVLLIATPATAQTEHVLVHCDAELRAGVMESSSRLGIPRERCDEATDGYGAWQVRLISRNGDLVHFSTLGESAELQNECSAGPVGLWPYVLRLYAPTDSLVPTVVEPITAKARDGREVRLRPGVPVHHVKGRWYRVSAGGEQVEVGLSKKQLTTVFGDPPGGACAVVDPATPTAEQRPAHPGPPPPIARYQVPEKAAVYLPTREEIGEAWAPILFAEEQTFQQGMLRCDVQTIFEWSLTGTAPLCFLELALDLAVATPADPPPTSAPAP